MKLGLLYQLVLALFFASLSSSLNIGNIIQNSFLPLPIQMDGTVINSKLILESSWHWLHAASDSKKNCLGAGGWNKQVCNSPESCWSACSIEGIGADQWANTYGIHVQSDAVTIGYVTNSNVGSRMYLADPSGQNYVGFNMLGRQLSFEADMSQAGCGLNGALYFVEMALNGGPNLASGSSASVGLGYCDAQCPTVNFINGKAAGVSGFYPSGACCAQFDIWQANSQATQMTTHTCKNPGLYVCNDDVNCGRNQNRYKGQCDMDGDSINPYRNINRNLYGTGSQFQIDTSKPFTVKTQFITDNGQESGNLVEIKRIYVQNGKNVNGGSIMEKGGNLKSMGQAFRRKMVLTLSLWDDYSPAHMLWLDGVYPPGSTQPWAQNGPCAPDSGNPDIMRKQVPHSKVVYSKIKVTKLSAQQISLQQE